MGKTGTVPYLQPKWVIRNKPPKVTQLSSSNPVGNATDTAIVTMLDGEVGPVSPPSGTIIAIEVELPRFTAIAKVYLVRKQHAAQASKAYLSNSTVAPYLGLYLKQCCLWFHQKWTEHIHAEMKISCHQKFL